MLNCASAIFHPLLLFPFSTPAFPLPRTQVLSLPLFPVRAGTDALDFLEHAAKIIKFSNASGKSYLFHRFVCKPQQLLGMGDADVLEIRRDAHAKLFLEDVDEVIFADVEIAA